MSFFIAIVICIIASIPFFWTFISKFCSLKEKSFCLFFKNIFLDESSLHKQPLFWLLITSPVIVSIILWSIISSEYKLEWTAHGYAGLVKYSQLPLMMLALSPILGAFVVYAHRSIQTAKQIEETEKKNKADLYYAKRKFINEQIKDVHYGNKSNVIDSANSLYLKFYKVKCNYEDKIYDCNFKELNKYIDFLRFRLNKIICVDFSLSINVLDEINSVEENIKKIDFHLYRIKKILLINDVNGKPLTKRKMILKYWDIQTDKLDISKLDSHGFLIIYINLMNKIRIELEKLELGLDELSGILFEQGVVEKKLPKLSKLKKSINNHKKYYESLKKLKKDNDASGDKLAAENQNPPE